MIGVIIWANFFNALWQKQKFFGDETDFIKNLVFEFCCQKLVVQAVSSTNLQTWRKKRNYFRLLFRF